MRETLHEYPGIDMFLLKLPAPKTFVYLHKGEGGAHLIGESPLLRQTNPRVSRQVPS
ncbi:hypothetical protein HanRHA438_Chr09g0413351 [Helianthus annuus]|nr:hypothetical protein HanIR_Chr09g0432551 [Helianthus annuus]KAJ0889483.1 hypothetical protein HanRHA438_Chr09g0413351 [Helianthus annuus]